MSPRSGPTEAAIPLLGALATGAPQSNVETKESCGAKNSPGFFLPFSMFFLHRSRLTDSEPFRDLQCSPLMSLSTQNHQDLDSKHLYHLYKGLSLSHFAQFLRSSFAVPPSHPPPTVAFMDSTSLRRPAGQESSIKATKGPPMMPSQMPCLREAHLSHKQLDDARDDA